MLLLTKALKKIIPPLLSQDGKGDDAIIYAKFFLPDANKTWYVLEYDGSNKFFGLVYNGEIYLYTYFYLSDLEKTFGQFRLRVERDKYFKSMPVKELKES
jgi:hypothetical protein